MSSYYEKLLATGEVKCIDEEIPFEIPATWEWCRLGDVIQLLSGRDLEPYHYNSDGIGIPYMTGASNFCHEELIVNRWTEVPVTVSHIGDLLITCKGTIGTMAFNNIGDIHIARQIMGISSSYVSLKYIKLCLEIHVAELQKAARSIIPGISRDDMLYAIIPLPPIEEQHRIVSKIREVLTYVERYTHSQTALHLLNESIKPLLRKSILQEAIQGKLVSQIEAEGTADELLEAIKEEKKRLVKEGKLKKSALTDSVIYKGDDNKYYETDGNNVVCIDDEIPFEIPKSGCWMRLNNLCRITNGFTPLRTEPKFWENGTISWFTVEDIHKQGEYIYQTSQRITNLAVSNDRIVRAGSILLCCTASVGQCAMTMIPITTNQQFNALTIKDEYRCLVNDDFLYLFAKTLEPILHDLAGKTTFEFISVKKVGNILIPIPPVLEQHRICEVTNKAIASIMRG